VGWIDTSTKGEFLKRESLLLPQQAYACAELTSDITHDAIMPLVKRDGQCACALMRFGKTAIRLVAPGADCGIIPNVVWASGVASTGGMAGGAMGR